MEKAGRCGNKRRVKCKKKKIIIIKKAEKAEVELGVLFQTERLVFWQRSLSGDCAGKQIIAKRGRPSCTTCSSAACEQELLGYICMAKCVEAAPKFDIRTLISSPSQISLDCRGFLLHSFILFLFLTEPLSRIRSPCSEEPNLVKVV